MTRPPDARDRRRGRLRPPLQSTPRPGVRACTCQHYQLPACMYRLDSSRPPTYRASLPSPAFLGHRPAPRAQPASRPTQAWRPPWLAKLSLLSQHGALLPSTRAPSLHSLLARAPCPRLGAPLPPCDRPCSPNLPFRRRSHARPVPQSREASAAARRPPCWDVAPCGASTAPFSRPPARGWSFSAPGAPRRPAHGLPQPGRPACLWVLLPCNTTFVRARRSGWWSRTNTAAPNASRRSKRSALSRRPAGRTGCAASSDAAHARSGHTHSHTLFKSQSSLPSRPLAAALIAAWSRQPVAGLSGPEGDTGGA